MSSVSIPSYFPFLFLSFTFIPAALEINRQLLGNFLLRDDAPRRVGTGYHMTLLRPFFPSSPPPASWRLLPSLIPCKSKRRLSSPPYPPTYIFRAAMKNGTSCTFSFFSLFRVLFPSFPHPPPCTYGHPWDTALPAIVSFFNVRLSFFSSF